MPLRVPKVDGGGAPMAAAPGAPAAGPKVPPQTDEQRAARTVGLKRMLDATKDLPPAERARLQMQFLAYPAAWSQDQWLDLPSDR